MDFLVEIEVRLPGEWSDERRSALLRFHGGEVLRLVARGLTARQIATRLVLSHRTVENHVQNTLRKLQLHNRAELVRYAIENGIDTATTDRS